MRAAVIGTGRMGLEVERVLRARGHDVTASIGRARNARGEALTPTSLGAPDVVLEFTSPDSAAMILARLLDLGLAVVSGTTGWQSDEQDLLARVQAHGGALLRAANFALGLHALAAAARAAARALGTQDGYDPHLIEVHHAAKRDAPSGTAIFLRKVLADEGTEVPITSVRTGQIPGTHTLTWDALGETVRLEHVVRSRAVFAEGAVRAAEWLVGRKGVFTIEQMLSGRQP